MDLKNKFIKWYESFYGKEDAYRDFKEKASRWEEEMMEFEHMEFDTANNDEPRVIMFSSEMYYAIPNPYVRDRKHEPFVVMKGSKILDEYDPDDLLIDINYKRAEELPRYIRWNKEYNELRKNDASVVMIFKKALENKIVLPLIEIDDDDIEDEFNDNFKKKYNFAFGSFEEWEIMKEMNLSYYKSSIEVFKTEMQSFGIYFYDKESMQWYRIEE